MYSSHSGTPVLGSLASALAVSVLAAAVFVVLVVVVEAVLVVLVVFAGLLAVVFVVFVAAPPQPKETIAKHRAAAIAIKLFIVIRLVYLTKNYYFPPGMITPSGEDKKHLLFF
jgi:hypothetical protein